MSKGLRLSSILFFLGAALTDAATPAVSSSQLPTILADNNFTSITQIGAGASTGDWFIKFYAQWCRHCQQLAPVWDQLPSVLKPYSINVGKVDSVANKDISTRLGIKNYPTLVFFKNDKMYRYQGPRALKDFRLFVTEGFHSVEAKDVPKVLGWSDLMQRALALLVDDIEYIWEYRRLAGVVLSCSGVMVGGALGTTLGAWLTQRNYSKARKAALQTRLRDRKNE